MCTCYAAFWLCSLFLTRSRLMSTRALIRAVQACVGCSFLFPITLDRVFLAFQTENSDVLGTSERLVWNRCWFDLVQRALRSLLILLANSERFLSCSWWWSLRRSWGVERSEGNRDYFNLASWKCRLKSVNFLGSRISLDSASKELVIPRPKLQMYVKKVIVGTGQYSRWIEGFYHLTKKESSGIVCNGSKGACSFIGNSIKPVTVSQ